jgi:hypothetical protein
MFANSITLDFKGTGDLILNRIDEGGLSSTFFGVVGVYDVTMTIKHTKPKSRVTTGASHLVRWDVKEYSSDGTTIVREMSDWRVYQTSAGQQDATTLTDISDAMTAFLDSTNLAALLNYSS